MKRPSLTAPVVRTITVTPDSQAGGELTEEEQELRIAKIRQGLKNFSDAITDQQLRFDFLANALKLKPSERSDDDLRTIAQLLLDYKYFVQLGAERQQSDPYIITKIAEEIEIVTFKPSSLIAL